MYYYIAEQPRSLSARKRLQKIKDILGDLGIAGEIVSPSPARSVDELSEIGLAKGYSTIVSIGSERHTAKIVANIIGKDIVLGIVPLDEPMLSELIGVSSDADACETLKFRKLSTIDLIKIEPNKYFLTQAVISSNKPILTKIETADFHLESPANQIIINRDLRVWIEDGSKTAGFFARTFAWFFGRKEQKNVYRTTFQSKKILIETAQSIPIRVGREAIAKTPISVRILPAGLKIIQSRANIRTKE